MNYTLEDLYKEERLIDSKSDPYINYKFKRTAMKNYTCEYCGVEIHKGEEYWEYKPNPSYNSLRGLMVYFKWRKRCIDDEPKSHSEVEEINAKERIYEY